MNKKENHRMIVDTESFVEIECKTAEQLIENLTKTNPAFAGAEDVRLFRGESDISRPLIPSAFRDKDEEANGTD